MVTEVSKGQCLQYLYNELARKENSWMYIAS